MARFQRGTLDLKLDGIARPDTDNQAANKVYVDEQIAGAALGDNVRGGTGISITVDGDTDVISITDGGVGETQLADSAVTTAKIAGNAVTTSEIADANVTTAKLADNSVDSDKISHSLTTPNLGLSQSADGKFRLSPAFVEAASVLALSTQYDSPASVNSAITRLVTNADGTGIMSGSVQADSNTNPSITAFNDDWNNVRSVVLSTHDASNPTRSIASLAQFFGAGSVLEIHRSDSDYAVWAIDSFSATYTAGNVTYVNINQTAWTSTGQTDRYGNPIYSGLLASSGSPGAQFGNNYTIRLHGRDSINDGRLIGDNTVLAEKLQSTNTPTAGQIPSFGANGQFTWTDAGETVTYNAVTDAIGEVDSWFGSDSDYRVLQDTDSELVAGSLRFYGLGPDPDPSLSAPSIFRIEVTPHTGRHANVMAGMVQGSVVRATQSSHEVVFALSSAPTVSSGTYTFQAASATHYVGTGTFSAASNVTFEFRPAPENPVVPGDFVPGAVRQDDINGGEISPYHMELESTGTPNGRQAGFYPVSGGTANGAGWAWYDAHSGLSIPAAEGLNTDQIVNVFRIPATGHQARILSQNVSYTSLEAAQHWGFIANEPTPTTVNFDTTALTSWNQIADSADFNSFYISNGNSGWNTSSVVPLIDTGNPETCGLVWFRRSDSDWGIFQWPAHSLNQGTTNGAVYTNERNLKLVASEGTPSNSMQVGLNINISPVASNPNIIRSITDPHWFFGADDRWHDGRDFFDRQGSAAAIGFEVDQLEKELNDGIGKVPFPVETEDRLVAQKEFNGLTISSDGRTMQFDMARPEDENLWSGFDDLFDDLLYEDDGLATIHFQLSHIDTDGTDTEFSQTDIVFESANDGTNQVFSVDVDSDTFEFQLSNGSTFATNNRIFFTDGNGNVIPGSVNNFRTGPGYFRKVLAYRATNNGQDPAVNLTEQLDEIGYDRFVYHGNIPSPAIPVITTADSEQTGSLASFGNGLSYDTANNEVDVSITPQTVTASGTSGSGRVLEATDANNWAWVNPTPSGWHELRTKDSDDKTPTTDGASYVGIEVTRGVTGGSFSGTTVTFSMNATDVGDLQAGDTVTVSGVTGVPQFNATHTVMSVTSSGNPRHIMTDTSTAGFSGTPSFTNAMATFITRAATGAQWASVKEIRISDSLGGTTQTPLFERLRERVGDSEVRLAIYNGDGFEAYFGSDDVANVVSTGAIGSRYWTVTLDTDAAPHIDTTFTRNAIYDYQLTRQNIIPTVVGDIAATGYIAGNTTRYLRADGSWSVPPGGGGGGTGVTVSTEPSDTHPSTTDLRFPGGTIVAITGQDGGEEIHPRNAQVWSSTARYYAGELVEDSDTLYYASSLDEQSVPVGTHVSDTTYWQAVGTYATFDSDVRGVVPAPTGGENTTDYFISGAGSWLSGASTTGKGLVPRLQSHADTELQDYYLDGSGEWRRVTHNSPGVFNDTETGLVPAPGTRSELLFLNSEGQWSNPIAVIDSEDLAHVLDFTATYDAPNHRIDFLADSRTPAIPATNGQRAWVVLTFNNSSINSSGTQPLESSAVLTLRAPTTTHGEYTTFNVHWDSSDIPQGHGSEGRNDVALIWANAIGRNYSHLVTVADIGEADNALTYQMVNDGPMVIDDRDSDNSVVSEFDTHFYTVTETYAQPGADRGRTGEYQNNTDATGAYGANAVPADDTEKLFDQVVLPVQRGTNAGLVPGYTGDQASDHRYVLRPGLTGSDAVWTSRNAIETVEAFDVVERVDSLGKIRTQGTNGLQWGTNNLPTRAIKQVQQATELESWTLVFTYDADDNLTTVQYYSANYGPDDEPEGDQLRATKTLQYNSDGTLGGTSIN